MCVHSINVVQQAERASARGAGFTSESFFHNKLSHSDPKSEQYREFVELGQKLRDFPSYPSSMLISVRRNLSRST